MRILLSATLLLGAASAQDQVRYPAKPGPREFILDEAKLIEPQDAAEIRALCDEALTKKKAPIVVVTIPSLASFGAGSWPIERYAMNLMDEWGVGSEDWNYGMLLLVSPGDRKVRIELGGSWARRKDEASQRIVGEQIVPAFKRGDYSKGIVAGVKGLHAIAMDVVPSRPMQPQPVPPQPGQPQPGQPQPSQPQPMPVPSVPSSGGIGLPIGGCGLIGLIAAAVIAFQLIGRMRGGGVTTWGSGGPGFGGWFGSSLGGSLLGSALGSMLYNSFSNRHGSSSGGAGIGSFFGGGGGGGGGGGSFSGGFSGGGGATGSW